MNRIHETKRAAETAAIEVVVQSKSYFKLARSAISSLLLCFSNPRFVLNPLSQLNKALYGILMLRWADGQILAEQKFRKKQ